MAPAQMELPLGIVDPAEEAARMLLRPYVRRGDDPQDLREGHMGHWGDDFGAHIGGYCDPLERFGKNRNYSTDHIIVDRDANGADCCRVFSFWKIYQAIQQEILSDSPSTHTNAQ